MTAGVGKWNLHAWGLRAVHTQKDGPAEAGPFTDETSQAITEPGRSQPTSPVEPRPNRHRISCLLLPMCICHTDVTLCFVSGKSAIRISEGLHPAWHGDCFMGPDDRRPARGCGRA